VFKGKEQERLLGYHYNGQVHGVFDFDIGEWAKEKKPYPKAEKRWKSACAAGRTARKIKHVRTCWKRKNGGSPGARRAQERADPGRKGGANALLVLGKKSRGKGKKKKTLAGEKRIKKRGGD